MIQLGVNSVLFKTVSFAEAAKAIALAGYDGVEISAIKDMCEHLDLDNYNKAELLSVMEETGLKFLSTEVASIDRERLKKAFEACADIGIPIVNVGPGGKADEPGSIEESIENLIDRTELAASYGITLCCKAHVGNAIYSTPTTLKAMEAISHEKFGIDMDPSHIWRAGENPADALKPVIGRTKHIHIRDCKGKGPAPGEPALQTCGRGDIDLFAYFKVMVDGKYSGPVCLEVIGPDQTLQAASVIAAESFGYMNAILKSLSAR